MESFLGPEGPHEILGDQLLKRKPAPLSHHPGSLTALSTLLATYV